MQNEIVGDFPPGADNFRNSEGAFVTLADGRILFAWSRYQGEGGGDHAPAVIAARTSTDGGRSWDCPDRVLVEKEGDCNVMSVSLLRLADGRIALVYLRKNSFHDCRPYLRFSSDEGESWSEPVLAIRSPGYYVVNNDRMVQLRNGRLIIPASLHRSLNEDPMATTPRPNDGRSIATFHYSDDAGASWQEAADWWALPVRASAGLQEPGVVELKNGSLYAWARTGTGRQWEMRSHDRGVTWSQPKPSRFRSPTSPLSMKRIPATGDLVAIWNDHSHRWKAQMGERAGTSWGRTPLAIAISKDEGKRWQLTKLLEDDPARGFCYIAIHPLEDALLLAYCCGGDGCGVLQHTCIRRVDYEWLYAKG